MENNNTGTLLLTLESLLVITVQTYRVLYIIQLNTHIEPSRSSHMKHSPNIFEFLQYV